MSQVFTEIYNLLSSLFYDAPGFVHEEICMWLAVAATLFLVAIPFILVYRIIRLCMGVGR